MTRIFQSAMKFFGFGPSDGDSPEKNFQKGHFSESAAQARDAFIEYKKQNPQVKAPDEMTPVGRRMQSGSV